MSHETFKLIVGVGLGTLFAIGCTYQFYRVESTSTKPLNSVSRLSRWGLFVLWAVIFLVQFSKIFIGHPTSISESLVLRWFGVAAILTGIYGFRNSREFVEDYAKQVELTRKSDSFIARFLAPTEIDNNLNESICRFGSAFAFIFGVGILFGIVK